MNGISWWTMKMNVISQFLFISIMVGSVPLQCAGGHLHGKYIKRSTEARESSRPIDDVTFKKEDMFPDMSVGQEESGHIKSPVPFVLNLPPWLRYYMEIWNELNSRRDDLRVKFPTEFESDINEIPGQPEQDENTFGLGESNSETTSDDGSDSASNWVPGDDATEFPEMTETPAFETPDSNLEIGDSNVFELPELVQESSTSDDIGHEQVQINDEVDNTETEITGPASDFNGVHIDDSNLPEFKQEMERRESWLQENAFSNIGMGGNWMQGMINSAMAVLPKLGNQISDDTPNQPPSDDIPDRISNRFDTNLIPQTNPFSHGGGWNNHVISNGPPDVSDDQVDSSAFSMASPFIAVPVSSLGANFGSHPGNNVPDNEQDSST